MGGRGRGCCIAHGISDARRLYMCAPFVQGTERGMTSLTGTLHSSQGVTTSIPRMAEIQ